VNKEHNKATFRKLAMNLHEHGGGHRKSCKALAALMTLLSGQESTAYLATSGFKIHSLALRKPNLTYTRLFSTPIKPKPKTEHAEEDSNLFERQLDKQKSLLRQEFDADRGEYVIPTSVRQTVLVKDLTLHKPESPQQTVQSPLEDTDFALRLMASELGVSRVVHGENFPTGRDAALPLDLVFERTLDTLEDVVVHARRMPYELGWLDENAVKKKTDRPTVVVLGSGWAAHAFIKVADTFGYRIIVVSPSNHFVFTPMLPSAAVGTVEYRSVTEAVRASNPMIESYIEGKAVGIDVDNQTIDVQLNSLLEDVKQGDKPEPLKLKYDKLLVAVGVKAADRIVPGAHEHCLRLKTCDDARHLRNSIGEALEYASRPDCKDDIEERRRRSTFAIVGGGPTGLELAGELSDFIKDISKPHLGAYPHLYGDTRVVLLHDGKELVPQFEEKLREHALRALQRRGVEVKLNARVMEVGEDFITWIDKTDPTETVQTLHVGLTSWCAGTEQRNFVHVLLEKLPESAKGYGGRINVDRWMRCPTGNTDTFGSILVLGDAASCRESSHFNATLLPQTAQVAGQQGAYAARLLCRGYDLSVTPPCIPDQMLKDNQNLLAQWLQIRGLAVAPRFDFLNLGLLAYEGGGEALTQVQMGDVPIFSYAGSVAFVLWRSVYLVKQVATRNRVLVAFDWIKSALFGRDLTRL